MSETPTPEETPVDETPVVEDTTTDTTVTEPIVEDPMEPARLYDYYPGGWERDDLVRRIEGEPFRVELDESINIVEIHRDGVVAAMNGTNWGALVGPDHWLTDENSGLAVRTRQAILSAAVDHDCEIQDRRRY